MHPSQNRTTPGGARSGTSIPDHDELVREHLPMVREVAWRIAKALPDVYLDDLVSAGIEGLVSAIENFDPSSNIELKSWVRHKVRGRILDNLRAINWAAGNTKKRTRLVAIAARRVESRTGRNASENQIVQGLHISVDEFHNWLAEIWTRQMRQADLRYLPDQTLPGRRQLEVQLRDAIDRMSDEERTLIRLYCKE